MKFPLPLAALMLSAASSTLLSPAVLGAPRSAPSPSLRVSDAVVAAMPPGSTTSALYLTLRNSSDTAVRLTGASTSVAGRVTPMKTFRASPAGHDAHGMANAATVGMQAVSALVVPARGVLRLTPEGDHLMLERLRRVPREGERVNVTLRLTPGGALTVSARVRRL